MVGRLLACDVCGAIGSPTACPAPFVLGPDQEHARRIRFGTEEHLLAIGSTGDLADACPSCQVPRGSFHHARCRLEECPTCAGGAWNCRCTLERLVAM